MSILPHCLECLMKPTMFLFFEQMAELILAVINFFALGQG